MELGVVGDIDAGDIEAGGEPAALDVGLYVPEWLYRCIGGAIALGDGAPY